MPAKKEYLSSPGQRALKITAGFLGGYFLSSTFHLLLAKALPFRDEVVLTATFTFYILWVILMLLAFLSRNGWKVWGIYLSTTILFAGLIYLIK